MAMIPISGRQERLARELRELVLQGPKGAKRGGSSMCAVKICQSNNITQNYRYKEKHVY